MGQVINFQKKAAQKRRRRIADRTREFAWKAFETAVVVSFLGFLIAFLLLGLSAVKG